MAFLHLLYPELPGIYKVINTENGRIYVGQTQNLRDRCLAHRGFLRTGRGAFSLQSDFDRCGESAFWFEVIEEFEEGVDRQILEERESYWIERLKPYYNTHSTKPVSLLSVSAKRKREKRAETARTGVEFGYPDITPSRLRQEAPTSYTSREFRKALSAILNREVSASTVHDWVTEACYWIGSKKLYTRDDLEWVLEWERFRSTRSRSTKVFHEYVKSRQLEASAQENAEQA